MERKDDRTPSGLALWLRAEDAAGEGWRAEYSKKLRSEVVGGEVGI